MPYYSTKGRGSGLGLAIVRRIVAEHGGAIEVGDNSPQGTRFVIELPCDGLSAHEAERSDRRRRSRRAQRAERRAARRGLRGRGGRHAARPASTASSRAPYDVIVLDIWLPGMDGLATLARLRERRVDAPVVMISGHGNIESAVRAIKLGAFDFVEKPLSLEKTVLVVGNARAAAPARGGEPRAARDASTAG